MTEQEYITTIKKEILRKAKEINFAVNEEELDSVVFEAFDNDMDIEDALKVVWIAVYLEEDEPLENNLV